MTPVADWLTDPETLFVLPPVIVEVVEPVPDLLVEGDPLTVYETLEVTEPDPDILEDPVADKDADQEGAGDPE